MATNRADTLDPALLRPGRLDRKIEFPLPSRREKRLIFQTITSKMSLGPDVDLEDCTPIPPLHFFFLLKLLTYNYACMQTYRVPTSSPLRKSHPYVKPPVYKVRYPPLCLNAFFLTLSTPLAVRKNRYIVLPIDFEEAWKVRDLNVTVILVTSRSLFSPSSHTFSKSSSAQTTRTSSVSILC